MLSLKATYTVDGRLEKVFTFNQDTEQEAIYNSVLLKQKKDLHKRIGDDIEWLYERNLDSFFEELGMHYEKAEVLNKAALYYHSSALKHKRLFNISDSFNYFTKALELETSLKNPSSERLLSANKEISEILIIMSKYQEVLDSLNKALTLNIDKEEKSTLLLMKARIFTDMGKHNETLEILQSLESKLNQNSSLYGSLLYLKYTVLRVLGHQEEALRIIKKGKGF
ncbi:MAG: hypothetical protein ACOZCL_07470 [Bacillota bacterium]